MKKKVYLVMGVLGLLLMLAAPIDVQAEETTKSEADTIEINGVTYDKRIENDKDDADVSGFSVKETTEEIDEIEKLKTSLVGMPTSEIKDIITKYLVDPNIKLSDMDKQKIKILEDELDKSFMQRWREESEVAFIIQLIIIAILIIVAIVAIVSVVSVVKA